MKKISLIISFVVLFVLGGNAQSGDFRFGLKLGPSFDWASSGSVQAENKGMRMGFNAGLVLDYYLTDHIAASSGINYNSLRMKYSFTDYRRAEDFLEEANMTVLRRLKASSIEIPIQLKVQFDVADSFGAYVQVGGGLGFNLKDYVKDEYIFYWNEYNSEAYEDYTNQYRAFQPTMMFGLGAEYGISRNLSAFAQLTFNHAFVNAFVSSLEKLTGSILRNNFIGVEVGLMY